MYAHLVLWSSPLVFQACIGYVSGACGGGITTRRLCFGFRRYIRPPQRCLGSPGGEPPRKIRFLKTCLIRGFARRFHRQNSPGAAGHSPGASWGRSQTSTPRVLRGHIYAKNTKIAPKSLTGRMVAPTTTSTNFGHPGLCARSPATLQRKTRAAADESAVVV